MTKVCPACGASAVATEVRSLNFGAPPVVPCESCGRAPADVRIGSVVAGKYRIERALGRGGMGVVYQATHLELGEPVAMKFLHEHWAVIGEIRARFRREAVALARLRHPAVVSLLDFGESDGALYMVMELVRGRRLSERLLELAPLTPHRAGPWFEQILAVLEAAHGLGLVHRDMKPDNVMLTDTADGERVKVLDFGLVGITAGLDEEKLTETGRVQGTAWYMSPEQCRGVDVGAKTDVYAVGVMLFEALAGRLPFEGEDRASVMAQHMFVAPPPLAGAASALNGLVRAALAKRPEDRPSAAELRESLALVLGGRDPESLRRAADEARARAAGLSRSERSITKRVVEHPTPESNGPRRRLVLWTGDTARATRLRDLFSVNGFEVTLHSGDHVPASHDVCIVIATDQGSARLRVMRRDLPTVPVLVLDSRGIGETAALIREGASDVTLGEADEPQLLKKVSRLLPRPKVNPA